MTEASLSELNTRSLALPKTASLSTLKPGTDWDFPLVELVLSQDPFRKRVDYSEALWISEFTPEQMQKNILTAAWISAFIRYQAHKAKLKLNAVNLRFSLDPKNQLMLFDAFSMDDLHFDGMHVDESNHFYQKTSWFEAVHHAKKHAEQAGFSEWKRLCAEPAPWLDSKVKQDLEQRLFEMTSRLVGA